MRDLFDYDGPTMKFLSKIVDLVLLNILTMLCCIPIITIGPAITAAHYAALKIHRGESYVFRNFWKSFKENFKQSIIIGLIFSVYIVLSICSFLIMSDGTGMFEAIVQGVILISTISAVLILLWVFPLQSKFVNPIPETLRNAFALGFRYIFRTLYMMFLHILPIVLVLVSYKLFSVVVLFGFSVPIYLSAIAYNKVFEKLENAILGRQAEDNRTADDIENSFLI